MIKRAVMLLICKPYLVTTTNMIADIFTKSTDKGTYARARNEIMNVAGGIRRDIENAMACYNGTVQRMLGRLHKLL